MNLTEKLDFTARMGAAAGRLLTLHDPGAQHVGLQLLSDLRLWRKAHLDTDVEYAELKKRRRAEEMAAQWKRETAPQIWAEWHRHALAIDAGEGDPSSETQWLQHHVLDRILCPTCKQETKAEIDLMLADRPWETSEYFAATVGFHNRVNRRLGADTMDIGEARALWSASQPSTLNPQLS
jgi:hypothetical protein